MIYGKPSDLWDVAHDEAYGPNSSHLEDCSTGAAFSYGAEWGAGWMAAIIGMGQAIRESTEGARVERVKAMFDKMDRLGL